MTPENKALWEEYQKYAKEAYGVVTPDLSELYDSETGKPFEYSAQQAALAKANQATRKYYDQLREYETQGTEAALRQKQLDYQKYLADSADDFQKQKTSLDEGAAESGVLFSGGRVQRQNDLQRQFERDQAYKKASLGTSIGDMAREYQYRYGNENANKLSKYYRLGSNTYNPNVATGGVGTGRLSNVYRTGGSDFFGTRNAEQMTENQTRAAGLLWNKGNKILPNSYTRQY